MRLRSPSIEFTNLCTSVKFHTTTSLHSIVKENFEELKEADDLCTGYIEPGHGWKGKGQWINNNEDLREML